MALVSSEEGSLVAAASTRETGGCEREGEVDLIDDSVVAGEAEEEELKLSEPGSSTKRSPEPSAPIASKPFELIRMKDPTFDNVLISAAANGREYSKENVIIDDLIHEQVFGFDENKHFWFHPRIFVSELRKYRLSAKYRVLSEGSLGYFAVRCFTDKRKDLNGYDCNRHGNPAIITGISEDNKIIVCDRPLKDWFNFPLNEDGTIMTDSDSSSKSTGIPCQNRSLALFLGGKESSQCKADVLIRVYDKWNNTDPNDGAYMKTVGNRIYLTDKGAALLKKYRKTIKLGSTIVRNVSQGKVGWWLYPFKNLMGEDMRQGTTAKGGWTSASMTLSCVKGIDFTRDCSEFDDVSLFRPGTHYIQLGYSHRKGKVNIDKIVFEVCS